MSEPTYLLLQDTETEIFNAASRIYASMIQSRLVTESNKKSAMKAAVQDAIDLAELSDEMVTAPDEHVDGRRRSYRNRGRALGLHGD